MSDFTPTVETLGDAALTNSIINRSVTEILDNVITSIGIRSLYGCAALENVKFENATNVGTAAFYGCTSLAKADFYQCVSFGVNAFYGCSALTALILRNSEAVSSFNSSFTGTPIASGTGYIYVPSALVETYKAASGWSAYADQIRAIEDYPVICNPYTWEIVFACIDDGSYASVYRIGDTVPLDLGTDGIFNMQIVAFDHDDLADGSGKAPITFISKELMKKSRKMNNSDKTWNELTSSAAGGWQISDARTYCNGDLYNLIPESVRSMIKEVSKISDGGYSDVTLITTTDKIWIPSVKEVGINEKQYGCLIGQGTAYEFFDRVTSRTKEIVSSNNYADWWLRSTYNTNKYSFFIVTKKGDSSYSNNSLSKYISFGFCV